MKKRKYIPIIDLFAGPGGLGEGFSSCRLRSNKQFSIRLSVEKDKIAHQTLTLRSFYRQMNKKSAYDAYFRAVSSSDPASAIEKLYQRYPEEHQRAIEEAKNWTLGVDNALIHSRIREIVSELGKNDHWVLIGGPPCQAYSIAGRVRNQGKDNYKPEEDERNFLYREYLNIIALYHPSVFVMENVKGILSADVNGSRIFKNIVKDLTKPNLHFDHFNKGNANYNLYSLVLRNTDETLTSTNTVDPTDFIIRSEQHGIPQKRHRVIILGVRSDIPGIPKTLKKAEQVNVDDVLNGLPRLRSAISHRSRNQQADWYTCIRTFPMLKRADFATIPEKLDELIKEIDSVRNLDVNWIDHIKTMEGVSTYSGNSKGLYQAKWYRPRQSCPVLNHIARSHMTEDLHRYLFAACFAKVHERSPRLHEYPTSLLPEHKNVAKDGSRSIFNDRFRVQVGHLPSTTVTSHIAKDGHYYIHPDPAQNRALTVREAARLQTFPDDYYFCGSRTSQYHQVGNAVPPLLANKIAGIVLDLLGNA